MNTHLFIASAVFHAPHLLLLPAAAVGYLLMLAALRRYSRGSAAAVTVLAASYARWVQHQPGTRCDEPYPQLIRVLPSVSRTGLRLVTGPTLLVQRLTGYVPRSYRYPHAGVAPMSDLPPEGRSSTRASRASFYRSR